MTQRIRGINLPLTQSPFSAGEVRGLEQAYGMNMSAYKKAVQNNATTTFANDADLWCELYGAGQHQFELYLPTTMTAAGGIKLQFVADQGLTIVTLSAVVEYVITGVANVVSQITALATPVNGGTTSAYVLVRITGSVDVVNGGVLQLQWAQQAASGNTAVNPGAYMITRQIVTDATF
jgi:hypothetical protein